MLQLAVARGTVEMVATPHANLLFAYSASVTAAHLTAMRERAGDTPRLHQGCEVHLTRENLEAVLAAPADYCLGGGQCLLLELPDVFTEAAVAPALARLLGFGLRPVIAHPERNRVLQRHPEWLEKWVARDCLVQLTGGSVTGVFGRPAGEYAERLLRRGVAHFVASDGHSCQRRPPVLDDAREELTRRFGARHADILLVDNPGAALRGGSVISLPSPSLRRRLFCRT
jgi:protein-tyrosine phosphatase